MKETGKYLLLATTVIWALMCAMAIDDIVTGNYIPVIVLLVLIILCKLFINKKDVEKYL